MSIKKLVLVISGIFVVVFSYFFDLIVGREEIILGPKSYTAIAVGVLLIIIGLALPRKK